MSGFDILSSDAFLETLRAIIVAGLFVFAFSLGRKTRQHRYKGWSMLIWGLALLMMGTILDITDNFPQLNRFIVIGETPTQAFLAKVVGYIGGFLLLYVGLRAWLPHAIARNNADEGEAQEEIRQRYRDLVDMAPDAVILHRLGKIIYANAVAAQLAGVAKPKNLIGRNIQDFVHPQYRVLTRERLLSLSAGRSKTPLIHIKMIADDGVERDVEVASGITYLQGKKVTQSVLRDISQRIRAELALKESERDLRSIFENMAEFYYRTDLNERAVRASGAAEEITGWTREEFIGLDITKHYKDPDGRARFLQSLEESGGRLRNFEIQMVRKDGRRIWVSVNAQYYKDKDGNILGIEGTVRDITDTVQARDVLEHMAMHDVLTGLGNRRSFDSRLKEALSRTRRSGVGGAVLYFDLDGFKSVNDTYGHDQGDSVLRAVGRRIKALARETDYVARIGGDEFCLIIEGTINNNAIENVANKLIDAVRKPYDINEHSITLGLSVGIAAFSGQKDTDTVHKIVVRADKAMYRAKNNGGNTFCFSPGDI